MTGSVCATRCPSSRVREAASAAKCVRSSAGPGRRSWDQQCRIASPADIGERHRVPGEQPVELRDRAGNRGGRRVAPGPDEPRSAARRSGPRVDEPALRVRRVGGPAPPTDRPAAPGRHTSRIGPSPDVGTRPDRGSSGTGRRLPAAPTSASDPCAAPATLVDATPLCVACSDRHHIRMLTVTSQSCWIGLPRTSGR
jgi:hypothetical protein